MYMLSIESSQEHIYVEKILFVIARLIQMQNDFIDCYSDQTMSGKPGTDIQRGKCAWPIVTALEKANKEQIEILKANYGKVDLKYVKIVKDIYDKLNLKEVFNQEKNDLNREIFKLLSEFQNKSKLNIKIYTHLMNRLFPEYKDI